MEADRRQQIITLFNRAVKISLPERDAFLTENCDDQGIRAEVETLLELQKNDLDFVKTLHFDEPDNLFETQQNQLSFGQRIGSYRILKILGAGGMGEVYQAEDIRLGRKVALKVLSPNFVSVPNLVRRFQQEARAASALNHPNILTIYEIGQENSLHFIAAEFIEGQTLRQIFTGREMQLDEVLDTALQIASALAAAHQAGIVHRDIKPQNIMVRPDGYVKVLDFGIAKLIEGQFANGKSSLSPNTLTGTIIGTATYMSPEQARGLEVDARSDIWSFGVTLYEMVTRQIPFKGQTTSDVIVSILEREPLSLTQFSPLVTPELDAVIKRCLAKDVDSRYQSATELVEELANLQQVHLSQETTNATTGKDLKRKFSVQTFRPQRYKPNDFSPTKIQPQGVNTKRGLLSYPAKIKTRSGVLAIILCALLLAFLVNVFKPNLFRTEGLFWTNNSAKPFQLDKINRLTNSGNVVFAHASPDGKYVAYVAQDADQQSLWIRQVTAAPSKLILPSTGNLYKGLTFSPDSSFIYCVVHDKAKGKGVLYLVSTLGGEPRKLLEEIDSPVTFAPDGKSFGFMHGFIDNGVNAHSLLIADLDGKILKTLATHRDPDFFSREGFAWSPDGKTIITAATRATDSALKQMYLVEIQVSDGSERPFTSQEWREIGRISWRNNGIVMTAAEAKSSQSQVFQISYPTGETQSITKGLNGYRNVSVTNDGRDIAAIESDRVSHIWTAATGNLDRIKRITPGVGRYYQTSWTPDNKIIYVSEESGNQDVWVMEADGSGAKQLTFDPAADNYPRVSPDGNYIIFASNRNGAFHLWRMDRDGGNLLQLTNGNGETYPAISPDGKTVYFMAYLSGKYYLSKTPIDGQNTSTIVDYPVMNGVISPNGKEIVSLFLDEQTNSKWQVGITSIADGKIVKTLPISTENQFQLLRWTSDGKAITYTDASDNLHNLWNYPLNESLPKQLTHFDSSDQVFYFDWSPDGKNLVCLRGLRTNDVVYLSGSSS